jgi:hypothetical protein
MSAAISHHRCRLLAAVRGIEAARRRCESAVTPRLPRLLARRRLEWRFLESRLLEPRLLEPRLPELRLSEMKLAALSRNGLAVGISGYASDALRNAGRVQVVPTMAAIARFAPRDLTADQTRRLPRQSNGKTHGPACCHAPDITAHDAHHFATARGERWLCRVGARPARGRGRGRPRFAHGGKHRFIASVESEDLNEARELLDS